MSDEEVDELLKGFPVQYVISLFPVILPRGQVSPLSPLLLLRFSFGDGGQELTTRDGQINYHSFVRSILAQ